MIRAKLKTVLQTSELSKAIARKKRRILYRLGGYGRQVVKSKLRKKPRKGKKKSDPNEPPYMQTGKFRSGVVFDVDLATDTTRIGVALRSGSGVADTLESGGKSRVKLPDGKKVLATYEPRPYLGPSLEPIEKRTLGLVEEERL